MFPRHFATLNHVWSSLILEELHRLGVRDIALAPGSRSAPLTMAAAAHQGFRKHLHFDERGLGFMALGLAKGSRCPVAIITTSGTAVANLWPAVAEAQLTNVPLIILSADRPIELIDNGANQAIDQAGIFAGYPIYQRDLPAPTLTIPASFILSTIDQALAEQKAKAGVVHLNCRYPEPLYPNEILFDASGYLAPLGDWLATERAWTPWHKPQPELQPESDWTHFSGRRGVIVAGQIDDPKQAEAVAQLAKSLHWPLLADLQSQLRFHPQAVSHYDLALNSEQFKVELGQAEVLLQFGARLISKRLSAFIKNHPWQDYWLVEPTSARLDPDYRLRRRLLRTPAHFAAAHIEHPKTTPWFKGASLVGVAQQIASASQDFSELGICAQLPKLLQGQLFVGNSMPPRLLDMLPSAGSAVTRVMTNRGASGIDGLIATAYGFAQTSREPTTLLIGDLSALHDLNSLALLRNATTPFIVLLINNDGGSIFRMLPVPQGDLLEEYYRLPHGLGFSAAAAMFGLNYVAPTSLDQLAQSYQQALTGGVTLIELNVPSEEVAEKLKALSVACRDA